MTMNHGKSFANCCSALKLTGPQSAAGKRASRQNSRNHGLNNALEVELSLEYQELVELIAEEENFARADIAAGLLNYRRLIDAYYDTQTSQ